MAEAEINFEKERQKFEQEMAKLESEKSEIKVRIRASVPETTVVLKF